MTAPPEARSPFHLLDELEEARELLVLSYTTNLDFFERFALSHARALGAIVTVISDATMVSADPVVVRRAGAAYLDARAVCPGGAFHPKLFVLVGEEAARIGIGSGNLTMAGWHGNAELLTVLRADRRCGPATVAAVAAFLRRLAGSPIAFSPGAEEALQRVAGRLDTFPADDPGPLLLDSLEAPILDSLPAGETGQLTCLAPYFDARLEALEALEERLGPQRLSVLLEARTSVDGRLLSSLASERGGELRWLAEEDRFHHGKLVEWSSGDRRLALTGSPNLSGSALLRSVAEGGNCELALLSEGTASLAPDSDAVPSERAVLELDLAPSEDEASPGILLLAATRLDAAVVLRLHAPLEKDGRVQAYDRGNDAWRTCAAVGRGEAGYTIAAAAAPVGTALRILLDDGTASNEVFVTDLARVRRPQMEAVGRVRRRPEEVALQGLGPELIADLEELRGHLLRVGALVPVASGGRDEAGPEAGGEDVPRARPAPDRDLEDYLAACDPVLGREMTEFALVLPALPGLGGDFDETAAGLEGDLDDDEAAAPGEPDDVPAETSLNEVLGSLSEAERKRWRRWVERLLARAPGLPPIVRTLALRSLLHGIAERIWDEEEAEPLILEAAKALAAPGDEPRQEELAAAGSLGAIAAAWMRAGIERVSVRDEQTLRYEELAAAVRPLLPHRDDERIEALAPGMPKRELGAGWVDASREAAKWILEPPRGGELSVRLLKEEHDLEAEEEPGGAIRLLNPIPAMVEPRLCLALGLARDEGPLVVRGTVAGGNEAVAAWRAPLLAIERCTPSRRWGDLYELPRTHTPFLYTSYDRRLPAPLASWQGDEPRPAAAEELLAAAEVSS